MFDIGTSIHAYRFYNEELSPELHLYFQDVLEQAISFDQLKQINSVDSISYSNYEIVRTLKVSTGEEEMPENLTVIHQAEKESEDPLTVNTLQLPLQTDYAIINAVSELHNTRVDNGAIRNGSVFRERIKGIASSEIALEPSDINRNEFFTSDVILGYRDVEGSSEVTLAHDRQIPENSAINFYYESYNLPENSEGLYTFALTYTIERDRSAIGSLLRFWKNEQTSMTIVNTNGQPVFGQMPEIVSEKLNPVSYQLKLEFSEREELQVLYFKEIPFTITV